MYTICILIVAALLITHSTGKQRKWIWFEKLPLTLKCYNPLVAVTHVYISRKGHNELVSMVTVNWPVCWWLTHEAFVLVNFFCLFFCFFLYGGRCVWVTMACVPENPAHAPWVWLKDICCTQIRAPYSHGAPTHCPKLTKNQQQNKRLPETHCPCWWTHSIIRNVHWKRCNKD